MDEIKGIRIVSLSGEKEYGIEDSGVREELANVVDGAPEELDSFKEAFEMFKEGGEALAGIAADVAAVGKAVTDEAGRAQQAEQVLDDKITEEVRRATIAEQEIEAKALDAGSAVFEATANAVALKFTTVEGVGNKITIPAATTEKAGVMSAEDKEKLDNLSQDGGGNITALRSLFVAAGAEYNDTDQVIKKTAPWKTEEKWVKNDDGTYTYWEEPAIVEHLPKHYYLNGLGDITEEEMMTIYVETFPMTKQSEWNSSLRGVTVRTNLFPKFFYASQIVKKIDAAFYSTKIDVIMTCYTDNIATSLSQGFLLNACSVKYIYGIWDVKTFSTLQSYAQDNANLRHIKLLNLKGSALIFNKSQHIYKRSILYTIQNASPTTAITITLHPDAYARIANQPDILAALEAQPLVTLVSA